jgi:hypothetical protein
MVGRRVLAAAVGAWLSVFIAAPAFAAGPRAGGASAEAVQLKASPLAVVPTSVFAQLSSVTKALHLGSVDSSLGNASLALDQTTVNGSLGSANVYGKADAASTPIVVNVKAIASALSILQNEINNLGLTSTVASIQQQLDAIEASLPAALQPYLTAVKNLETNGSFQLQTAHAVYPGSPSFVSLNVVDPNTATGGALQAVPIIQTKALAPYTAAASDGDATIKHTVEATSSLDALDVLDLPAIQLALNTVLAQLNAVISELESALTAAAPSLANQLSSVTGTVSSTLSSTLSTLSGVVGTTPVNNVIPASTTLSSVGTLLTQLLNVKAALGALPTSIDLSDIATTNDVASDVKTTVTNGVVDSIATTKAADIKLLTVNAGSLTQALGVAQGSAIAEIVGATATAEAKADGKTSTATGSGQFTDIKLLPGTPFAREISFQTLTSLAGCAGAGSTCTVNAGPLRLQILTGACACIDQAHGGTADAASAQVAALEIKLSYIGDPNALLGTSAVNAITSPDQSTVIPLLDAQLATVNANAGNQVQVLSAQTGSPYGVGLLVGFLMLVGALGVGLTYRRFAAVKVRS